MSKPKKHSPKSTQAEINQRLTEVKELLLNGYTRNYILQYGSKWALSDRQVDEYMAMATAQIKEINSITTLDTMAMICSNLWDLYRKASKENNISEQHKILTSIAKLKGLEQSSVTHTFVRNEDLIKLSNEDLDKAMAKAMESRH